jgi:hypothetical protein
VASNSAGIRVTQIGVSEPYAADYQFVFNSDWPSLAIAYEVVIDVPYTDGFSISAQVTHGLGFYPLVMGWSFLNGVSIGRSFVASGNLSGPQNDVQISFDKQNIYFVNKGIYNALTYTMSIKCYNVDISQGVDYTLPQFPTVKTPYDPTTGIKVSKNGKSIASNDLRDFILHSRAQSPAILSIVTQVTTRPSGTKYIGYNNPAGYVPWVLGFVGGPGQDSTYSPIAPGAQQSGYLFGLQSAAQATANGETQALLQGSFLFRPNATFGSLVVLRDPLVLPNTLRVTY